MKQTPKPLIMNVFKLILISLITFIFSNTHAQYGTIDWEKMIFDTASPYVVIDTSLQNIWQIGTPDKSIFDSAYSNNICLITDTIISYPVNNHSYFDVQIGTFNHEGYFGSTFVEFKHKYNTDTLRDGGSISVSYDKGVTWRNVIKDANHSDINPSWENDSLYNEEDTLFNGEFGFSGTSDGWITSNFGWVYFAVKSTEYYLDTMLVRFNFYSDNLDNQKDGWMIDNIKFYRVDMGSPIKEFHYGNSAFRVYPNPVEDFITVEFEETFKHIELQLIGLNGQVLLVKEYFNLSRLQMDVDLPGGIYLLVCKLDGEQAFSQRIVINSQVLSGHGY